MTKNEQRKWLHQRLEQLASEYARLLMSATPKEAAYAFVPKLTYTDAIAYAKGEITSVAIDEFQWKNPHKGTRV